MADLARGATWRSAFLDVHALARFGVTWARAGGTLFLDDGYA